MGDSATVSSSFMIDVDPVGFFGVGIGGSGAGFPNSSLPFFRSNFGRFRPFFRIGASCFESDFGSESDLMALRFGDPLTVFGFRVGDTDPSTGGSILRQFDS